MNTIRNFKVRVCDYTESQPIIRKRIQTLTDGPGLLFALNGADSKDRATPRFRQSDPEPCLADEWLD
jgi:hypothetical protein